MKMFRCMIAGAFAALALCTSLAFADSRLPAIQVGYMAAYSASQIVDHAVVATQADTRTAAVEARTGQVSSMTLHSGYLTISNGYAPITNPAAGLGVWLDCRTVV